MKKKSWLLLIPIAACVVLFMGYCMVDRISTDTKTPEIYFSDEMLQISVNDSKEMLLQGVTASDNRDGDVTASIVVESIRLINSDGTINVGYAAFDNTGNVAKATRKVKYTDYISPRFTLSEPLMFSENTNFDALSYIKAYDQLDGDITHRIRATSLSEGTITQPGIHNVEFRVTNSLNETVKLVIPVEVYAAGAYEAKLALTDYLVYIEAGSYFNPESYLDTFTRGSNKTYLQNGLPYNYNLYTEGEVDTGTPGIYYVNYSVTNTVSNQLSYEAGQTYTGHSKLIVVVEG